MGCDLITVEDVEDYMGSALSSANTVTMGSVISAVSDWVNGYLNTNLCDDLTIERVEIADGIITLNNHPRTIYGAFSGLETVIEVTGPNVLSSINIIDGANGDSAAVSNQKTLKLINNFSETVIDITNSSLSGVATSINNESGWTATYVGTVGTYGAALYAGNFQLDVDLALKLGASTTKIDIARTSERVYQTGLQCGSGHIFYQSGYEELPDDLQDALIRITIQAYDDRNPSSVNSGELKKEKIGDYEYEVFSASDLNASLASLALNYKEVLDRYRTVDI